MICTVMHINSSLST